MIHDVLYKIVSCNTLHAKWLNTLSYLENCGARKIAACQHPTLVKEEMLKHAAEEFRHAHYLKRQIIKISEPLDTYADVLGGVSTLHYLKALDVKLSRELKRAKLDVRKGAYLLVTYTIELRALDLYTAYDAVLREHRSKVTVKSILLEEKEHLYEMEEGMDRPLLNFIERACEIEGHLYKKWLDAILIDLSSSAPLDHFESAPMWLQPMPGMSRGRRA